MRCEMVCPERHRCLDLDRPTHCPMWRAIVQKDMPIKPENGRMRRNSERREDAQIQGNEVEAGKHDGRAR